jgi:ankyrin repeat protein
VTSLLLEKHATVNQVNNNGWTALIWAANNGHAEVVQRLLQAGADKAVKTKGGKTALDLARSLYHPAVVALLLQ